jgi:hypothetical protein
LLIVRLVTARNEFTAKTFVCPPPLSVMMLAPSMAVFVKTFFTRVTVMVTGLGPQLNVTLPPPASAASNAASVQLAGVPVPTTPLARAGLGENKGATDVPTARAANAANSRTVGVLMASSG